MTTVRTQEPMPNLPPEIEKLRELLARAQFEGSLIYQEHSDAYTHIVRDGVPACRRFVVQFGQDTSGKAEARARLYAAAVNALPDLLALIQSLTEREKVLVEAWREFDEFAWTAVTADCEEARLNLQRKIDKARAALSPEASHAG